jgi:hypothetical protein
MSSSGCIFHTEKNSTDAHHIRLDLRQSPPEWSRAGVGLINLHKYTYVDHMHATCCQYRGESIFLSAGGTAWKLLRLRYVLACIHSRLPRAGVRAASRAGGRIQQIVQRKKRARSALLKSTKINYRMYKDRAGKLRLNWTIIILLISSMILTLNHSSLPYSYEIREGSLALCSIY